MTAEGKLEMVKAIMGGDAPDDNTISAYLNAAKSEILSWRYSYAPVAPEDVPAQYEMTQIQAVVNGFTQRGNEGQSVSIENGIHRHFSYPDMVRYIRANVIAIAGLAATPTMEAPAAELRQKVYEDVMAYVHENALEVYTGDRSEDATASETASTLQDSGGAVRQKLTNDVVRRVQENILEVSTDKG